jgi:membrane protein YqaA with SNARE-associated domain
LEGLTVKAFEANQLNFDGLLFLAVLGYVDAGFVKRSVGNAQLLRMVEGLENLVGNLCNYVFGYVLLLTANERNELGRIYVLLDKSYYVAVDQNVFEGCNRWVLKLGQIHQPGDVVLLCREHRIQVSDVLGVVLKER